MIKTKAGLLIRPSRPIGWVRVFVCPHWPKIIITENTRSFDWPVCRRQRCRTTDMAHTVIRVNICSFYLSLTSFRHCSCCCCLLALLIHSNLIQFCPHLRSIHRYMDIPGWLLLCGEFISIESYPRRSRRRQLAGGGAGMHVLTAINLIVRPIKRSCSCPAQQIHMFSQGHHPYPLHPSWPLSALVSLNVGLSVYSETHHQPPTTDQTNGPPLPRCTTLLSEYGGRRSSISSPCLMPRVVVVVAFVHCCGSTRAGEANVTAIWICLMQERWMTDSSGGRMICSSPKCLALGGCCRV